MSLRYELLLKKELKTMGFFSQIKRKESLNLQVGDWIIWQDEAIETEGGSGLVSPGMKGKVISLHDGFHLDVVQGEPIPPKAIVQFQWHGLGGG